MKDTGLSRQQVLDMEIVQPDDYDPFRTYVYGQSLVNPDRLSSLGTQMYLLNKWYLKMYETKKVAWIVGRTRPENYLDYDTIHVEFNELHQLLNQDSLDKSLISCWCL
jgi:hypothetical protein